MHVGNSGKKKERMLSQVKKEASKVGRGTAIGGKNGLMKGRNGETKLLA
jgi:hypothetical protein